MSFRVRGTGSPRARARCTVRAASSHITAALTASRGGAADGEDAVIAHQHRRRSMPGEQLDDPAADLLVADPGERPDRDLTAELVRHRGEHTRDRLAAGGERRRVGAVGVGDAADVGAGGGRRSRGWRRRSTQRGRPRRRSPKRSQTTIVSGVSASNWTPLALITISSSPGTRAERFPLVQLTSPCRGSSAWSSRELGAGAPPRRRSAPGAASRGPAELVHHRAPAAEGVVERRVVVVELVVASAASGSGRNAVASRAAHRRRRRR